jgi:hypothetical protein
VDDDGEKGGNNNCLATKEEANGNPASNGTGRNG